MGAIPACAPHETLRGGTDNLFLIKNLGRPAFSLPLLLVVGLVRPTVGILERGAKGLRQGAGGEAVYRHRCFAWRGARSASTRDLCGPLSLNALASLVPPMVGVGGPGQGSDD
jgi:hypothetical protein